MTQEREPQKEPVDRFCFFCKEEVKATWKITTQEEGVKFLCDNHRMALKNKNGGLYDEEILWEAQWRMENEYDEKFDDFSNTDEWEDGSLYEF